MSMLAESQMHQLASDQVWCNRVDNTHPDTLARPFTFAPLHMADNFAYYALIASDDSGCWSQLIFVQIDEE